jgi:hypothetical protein
MVPVGDLVDRNDAAAILLPHILLFLSAGSPH